jgi:hypothetical protein
MNAHFDQSDDQRCSNTLLGASDDFPD